MPEERIVDEPDLTEAMRGAVRAAIVADPDPEALRTLPALEWVQSTWAGVERLLDELPPSLPIVRMVDPNLATVMSEAVLAVVLWIHRQGPTYACQQRAGLWRPLDYVPPGDRSVLVLGLGALGEASARRLRANGFRTLGWNGTGRDVPEISATFSGRQGLLEAVGQADFVVCLLPLTTETRGLLDATLLAAMPRGATLVNFARGPIVDEAALLAALDRGQIEHAVLDVFDVEPLPAGHPLWAHPRVTVWPHVSGPTDPGTASAIVARNVHTWRASGALPPVVDRARGY